MHGLKLLEFAEQLSRHSNVVAVTLQLGDKLTLAANIFLARRDVSFGSCQMLQQGGPVHAKS